MFIHHRTLAFVLKKVGQGENNQFLTVYTENFGKIKILARAVRKTSSKLRPFVELFCLSELEFIQGKNYKILTDAVLIDGLKNSKKSLLKLSINFEISDVFDKIVRGEEKDKKVWQLLRETFQDLNELKNNSKPVKLKIIYYYFFWNFLSLLGYRPELYTCFYCRKKLVPERNYFSYENKAIICQNCFKKVELEKKEISLETIKILRIIFEKNKKILFKLKVEKKYLKELKEVSDSFFSEILK